jgi:hypothetical protein
VCMCVCVCVCVCVEGGGLERAGGSAGPVAAQLRSGGVKEFVCVRVCI